MDLTGLRLALFADVHANREALAACLAHAQRQGFDRAVFLGDLVGYCADPAWVLDEIGGSSGRGPSRSSATTTRRSLRGPQAAMHPDAAAAALWTAAQLDEAHRTFLAGLPLTLESGELLIVHANAWAPRRWGYLTSAAEAARSLAATGCRVTFFGHVHEPAVYHLGDAGGVGAFTPGPGVAIPLVAAPALGREPRLGGAAARRRPRRVLRDLRLRAPPPRVPPGAVRRGRDGPQDPRRRAPGALRGAAGGGDLMAAAGTGGLAPGAVLDGFRIEERLHQGGMATVWRASRADLPLPVALKTPRAGNSDDPAAIVSFETELVILPRLAGPHVPLFVAAADFDAQPYLAMEFIPGATLEERLAAAPLPPPRSRRSGRGSRTRCTRCIGRR